MCLRLLAYFLTLGSLEKGKGKLLVGEMACLKATALVQWPLVRSSQQPVVSSSATTCSKTKAAPLPSLHSSSSVKMVLRAVRAVFVVFISGGSVPPAKLYVHMGICFGNFEYFSPLLVRLCYGRCVPLFQYSFRVNLLPFFSKLITWKKKVEDLINSTPPIDCRPEAIIGYRGNAITSGDSIRIRT